MTFEELDIRRNDEEKKRKKLEQEKSEQFWLEKQILRETTDLLHDLALKISNEFGIDISEAKDLIQWDTLGSLDNLKWNINTGEKLNLLDLQNAISEARSTIEEVSRKKRESLKEMLEEERFAPEKHEYKINKKLFSQDVLYRVQNPKNIPDHVMGLWLGIIDSTEAVILFTYGLGKWILLTPYHLYLLISGQARYKGIEKI